MNIPQQQGGPQGGFQSAFPGSMNRPLNVSGGISVQPGFQSALRPGQPGPLGSNIKPLPSELPNVSLISGGGVGGSVLSKPAFSSGYGGTGLDQPPDEGIIHNIKEIRMPPKPKSFRFG